eukprot:TRINITY_DN12607_c0_g1_i1.p1 TRINITY_DN12607_c0_g1~~TRINITY_DN12607_c0_g1_i1.p1  ORF type:complete len:408 (-),score=134.67 TRINITY_DN12607_c0_g1_i1:216-1439(-)
MFCRYSMTMRRVGGGRLIAAGKVSAQRSFRSSACVRLSSDDSGGAKGGDDKKKGSDALFEALFSSKAPPSAPPTVEREAGAANPTPGKRGGMSEKTEDLFRKLMKTQGDSHQKQTGGGGGGGALWKKNVSISDVDDKRDGMESWMNDEQLPEQGNKTAAIDDIFDSIFGEQDDEEEEESVDRLKYRRLYPKKVFDWIADGRASPGFYDTNSGQWLEMGKFDYLDSVDDEWREEDEEEEEVKAKREILSEKIQEVHVPPIVRDAVDPDLVGQYRFGVQAEEVEDASDKVKDLLSFKYANDKEIEKFRKSKNVENFGRRKFDTGSTEVQIANLSVRITLLTQHVKVHWKDQSTKYGFMKLISRRNKLMQYLKRNSVERYYHCIKELGLRDNVVVPVTTDPLKTRIPGKR